MPDALTVPDIAGPQRYRLGQDAMIRKHADWAFKVHTEAQRVTFRADFPGRQETVTLNRNEIYATERDFERWTREVADKVQNQAEDDE